MMKPSSSTLPFTLTCSLYHPEATTTVQDGSISEVKLDASLDTKVNEAYSFDEITVTQTADGWRLNESDGLCASNASYKMLKYAVVQGQRVKVVTDDRFQFQNKVQVPSTGTSNRVGETYSAGTYELTVPEGATYLIVSTLKTGGTGVAYMITNRIDEALNGISSKADRAVVNLYDKTVTKNEGKIIGTTVDTVNLVPTGLSSNSSYDTPNVVFPVTASSYVAVPKNFYGSVAIFNGSGTRQQIKDESALSVGKNCLYISTLSNTKYVAVSFNKTWYPNYDDEFIIVDGTNELPEEYIPHSTTFVRNSKVLVSDVVGLPQYNTDQNTKMTFATDSFNEAYAARVQEKQTANSLTITFVTDTHTDLGLDTVNTDKSITRALEVGYVGDYLGQDLIIHGGDLLTYGYQTKDVPIHSLRGFLNRCYKFMKAPFIVAKGNHDDASLDTQTSGNKYNVDSLIMPQEWNAIAMQYARKCAVCPSSGNANYCYFDNERTKIRVFVLDSEDIDYKVNDGVAKYNTCGTCAFSNEQLNFVANALLFEDKDNPSEWAALFVSHRPMDTTTTSRKRFGNGDILIRNHDVMLNIIRAYQSGTAYSDSGYGGESQTEIDSHDFPYDVDIDYTSKGAGEVIAFLCGHTHVCNTSDEVGANSSALSYGFRFVCCGSVSFYTLVFNRDTKKINVFFYKSDKDDVQLVSSTGEGAIIGLTASDLDQYGDWETSWT